MADPKVAVTYSQPDFLKFTVGFEQFFREPVNSGNFPPHNIEMIDEDRYVLTLAVAGFKKDEIDITLFRGYLRIEGKKIPVDKAELDLMTKWAGVPQAELPPSPRLLYQGIAFRDFAREFKLGEDVEVTEARLEDGLLSIHLNRFKPEENPIVIAIR